jgi:dTDP-4-dehydrorhamnose reductase
MSRYALAQEVCKRFDLDLKLLQPKETHELRLAAKRPLKVRLDCSQIRSLGIYAFRSLEVGLESLKDWYLKTAEVVG